MCDQPWATLSAGKPNGTGTGSRSASFSIVRPAKRALIAVMETYSRTSSGGSHLNLCSGRIKLGNMLTTNERGCYGHQTIATMYQFCDGLFAKLAVKGNCPRWSGVFRSTVECNSKIRGGLRWTIVNS